MNKILFYVDFAAYRESGMTITGLTYKGLNYGPVPEHWERIYSQFDEIIQTPRIIGEREGTELQATAKADKTKLTDFELEILHKVCTRFGKVSSAEISRISHEEEAWLQCNATQDTIPLDYAFLLKAI